MIFNTAWFWPFLVLTLVMLRLIPSKCRPWVALAACLTFHYHYAGPAGMAPILALGSIVYCLTVFFEHPPRRLKAMPKQLIAGIVLCTGTLVYVKYRTYLASLLHYDWKSSAIPLGISFFTFEFIHYLVEISHGGKPIRSPRNFALFTVFFPSLVAGPIKRYSDFVPQIEKKTAFTPSSSSIVVGGTRLLVGAGKKIILADPLATFCDQLHAKISQGTTGSGASWLLVAALTARIYMDFSGYSDMAIGAARMLNIRIPENFNWPYAAKSLQDFWRRWHISLSTWIRDYLYIPLGGSKVSSTRRAFNFFLAFGLCGLWHGAATHFVAWGLWHGGGLAAERAVRGAPAMSRISTPRLNWINWASTFLFVSIGWLLFFYPVTEATSIAASLVGWRIP